MSAWAIHNIALRGSIAARLDEAVRLGRDEATAYFTAYVQVIDARLAREGVSMTAEHGGLEDAD